jgi:hypothetical protein
MRPGSGATPAASERQFHRNKSIATSRCPALDRGAILLIVYSALVERGRRGRRAQSRTARKHEM